MNTTDFSVSLGEQFASMDRSPRRIFLWFFDFLFFPLLIIAIAGTRLYRDGFFLSWDEGAPLYWGSAVLQGQVPLKDFHITFGPLYVYLLAFCMKVFGASLVTLRTYVYIGSIVSLILVYFAARMLIKRRLLLILLCWYVASFSLSPYWMSRWGGIRIGITLVPLLFLIHHVRKNTLLPLMLSGLTAGISLLISQEMGMLAVGLFLIYLGYTRLDVLRKTDLFILGFLIATLPCYSFLWASGASIKGFYVNFVTMPMALAGYYRNPPLVDLPMVAFSPSQWLDYLQSASFEIVFVPVLYIVAVVYLITSALVRGKRQDRSDNLIFLLILFYGVFVFMIGLRGFSGPRFAGPQFTFSLASAAVVGLALVDRLLSWIECVGPKKGILFPFVKWSVLLLVVSGVMVTKITPEYRQRLQQIISMFGVARPIIDMPPRFGNCLLPEGNVELIMKVSDFIINHTKADECIYVYPHDPHFYFFTGRNCATFFPVAIDAGIRDDFQRDEIDRIEKKQVQHAICVANSYDVMDNRRIRNQDRIPLLYSYFEKKFTVIKNFDGILILERRLAPEDTR